MHRLIRIALPILIIAALVLSLPQTLYAATFTPGCTGTTGDAAALQAAITTASTNGQTDTITLSAGCTYTLTAQLNIGADGGNLLTIEGNGATISGNNSARVLNLSSGANVEIYHVTISGGGGNTGDGGGIFNGGTLTINNSTVSGNWSSFAGGIHNGGTLTLNNSVVSGNQADAGGGIRNDGTFVLNNSTVSDNSATFHGGGIDNYTGTITLNNSTVSGNSANSADVSGGGGGIFNHMGTTTITLNNSTVSENSAPIGGGINNQGEIVLNNSIVANSLLGGNCSLTAGVVTVNYSLIEDGSCGVGTGPVYSNGNRSGDPSLGALTMGSNGTAYHPLLEGSIAVNAGSNDFIPDGIITDQSGNPRIRHDDVDMGSFESDFDPEFVMINPPLTVVAEGGSTIITLLRTGEPSAELTVNVMISSVGATPSDYSLSSEISAQIGSGTVTFAAGASSVEISASIINDLPAEAEETLTITLQSGAGYDLGFTTSSTIIIPANDLLVTNTAGIGEGSLHQAITNANNFPTDDTIDFDVTGILIVSPALPTITANGTLTINGEGIILDGNNNTRGLDISSAVVTINNLSIMRGSVTPSTGGGGGIRNQGGSVILNGVTVSQSNINGGVTIGGGGILNQSGSMILNESTVSGNGSGTHPGGGIANYGTLTLNNSTISGNSGGTGSGGLFNNGVSATLNHVTIANNFGGGIRAMSTTIVNNSIVDTLTGAVCTGTVTAQHSLFRVASCGVVNGVNGNITNVLIQLKSLTGSPAYHPLTGGANSSPAINAGNGSLTPALTTDQRGLTRPQGSEVDMGSVEYDPSFTIVSINPAIINVNEGSEGIFTLNRTGSTTDALIVTLSIINGDAVPGTDYSLTGNLLSAQTGAATLVIPAGFSSTDITLEVLDDLAAEPEHIVWLMLTTAPEYDLGTPNSGLGIIPANDLGVTTTADSGSGSLRQAVLNANTFSGVNEIVVLTSGTIALTSGELPTLVGEVTINGNGITVDALNNSRPFSIDDAAEITLNNMTITGGSDAGIATFGTTNLTLNNVTVTGNTAWQGAGVYFQYGTLVINNSTISNNIATSDNGGGIYNGGGMVYITGSTISGNQANSSGGGIYNNSGEVSLLNSTIAENAAVVEGGGIYNRFMFTITNSTLASNEAGSGGGIFTTNFGYLGVTNSIIIGSTGGDCVNETPNLFISFSLISDGDGICEMENFVNGNLTEVDPYSVLDAPMGSPMYYPLLDGSLAIDVGDNNAVDGVDVDQAGNHRIFNDIVDMGSVESGSTTPPTNVEVYITADSYTIEEFYSTEIYISRTDESDITEPLEVNLYIDSNYEAYMSTGDYTLSSAEYIEQQGPTSVTIPADETFIVITFTAILDDVGAEPTEGLEISITPGDYDIGYPASAILTIPYNSLIVNTTNLWVEGSLQQAVSNANDSGGGEITIPPGEYLLNSYLFINGNVTLEGTDTATTILDGQNATGVIVVNQGDVHLHGFTIRNGNASTGGGIFVYSGNVSIGNAPMNIIGNHADVCGGGIYVETNSTVIVQSGSQINQNTSDGNGGGICVEGGSLTVQDVSQINENEADGNGGGIYHGSGTTNVTSAIINDNEASVGGAIYFSEFGTRSVTATCITRNTDTSVVANGTGVIATGNWWGSPAGPYSGDDEPNPPNDDNTIGSAGDSVTLSDSPATFDYSGYASTPLYTGCLLCNEVSSIGMGSVCNVP